LANNSSVTSDTRVAGSTFSPNLDRVLANHAVGQVQVALDLFDQTRAAEIAKEDVDALELLLNLVGQFAASPVFDL